MKRESALLVVLLVILVTGLSSRLDVQRVEASGTVCIRADGSVDPATFAVLSLDNVTYTLTGDFDGSIIVERDSIIVDGAGYTLQGTGAIDSTGVDLSGRSNVTIKNTNVRGYGYGVYLNGSSGNNIVQNSITDNGYSGIRRYYSLNNRINRNSITGNQDGIFLPGSSNNTIAANDITNSRCGLFLEDSLSNSISRNNIDSNGWIGVELDYSSANSIVDNSIANNSYYGMRFW